MSVFDRPDFDELLANIVFDSRKQSPDCDLITEEETDEWEDDGQPSEYDEWQDFYGGDDWDHGQYDEYQKKGKLQWE